MRFLVCFSVLLCWLPYRSSAAEHKTVMVYYMPWFTAKPFADTWGWHWTMDHFDPDRTNAAGQREIASWYYPLIGPYDSSDPAVLEYHVLLMKLAGVDGVIVDWYGSADHLDYAVNNKATAKLFNFTRKAGLKFAICYEDQTVKRMVEGEFLVSSNAVSQARRDMAFLQESFFNDPSYLRLEDRPVLLNFGPQFFSTNSDWESIFAALAPSNRPAFFTEDNRLPVSLGAFNWPPMWMSQAPGTGGVLSEAALQSYLVEFDRKAAAWPASISSAFPRFHDIYQRAGVRNYWGYLGDRDGQTFRETLSRAMTNSSSILQVVTWNDFGEGSVIEPTHEYGYRDLATIQEFRRQYLQADFSRNTNDLRMAWQVYQLRQCCATNAQLSADLDAVFTNLVSGKVDVSRRRLDELSRSLPAKDVPIGKTPGG
jgi:hypothetical protein